MDFITETLLAQLTVESPLPDSPASRTHVAAQLSELAHQLEPLILQHRGHAASCRNIPSALGYMEPLKRFQNNFWASWYGLTFDILDVHIGAKTAVCGLQLQGHCDPGGRLVDEGHHNLGCQGHVEGQDPETDS